MFYHGVYHTLVMAPATSNTVAKCVLGISDTLATNVFAQAGKCRVPAIVFACDSAPEMDTPAPEGMVKVYPRRIDLENTRRLAAFERTRVVVTPDGTGGRHCRTLRRAVTERLVFLTGHLAHDRLRRILEGLGETDFAWEVIDIGVKVAALMTEADHPAALATARIGDARDPARARGRGPGAAVRRIRRAL